MFDAMLGMFRGMDSVAVWGGVPLAKVPVQADSVEERIAYREALGGLRAAQRHVAGRPAVNRVLMGEIEAAIRDIQAVGTWEVEAEGFEARGGVGDALACLVMAEEVLGRVKQDLRRRGVRRSGVRQVLLHVRTARWWAELQMRTQMAPRYSQVLVVR